MIQVNLPTELLRTFVTVIEVESYTHAATLLGRTQPAISLQMKRLEDLVGKPLIQRTGRVVTLTEQGEALIVHARQILRLNDIAVSQFGRNTHGNTLRIGLPLDYGVRMLQSCVTTIVQQNPDMQVEVRCELSHHLLDALRKDELDVAVALYPGGDQQFLYRNWLEKPMWVGAEGHNFAHVDELPLVVHPYGCAYRDRMTDALKQAKRRWRIAFSSPGISSLQQAILDGFGVSCLTGPTMLDGLAHLPQGTGLPELDALHIGLFYRQTRLDERGHKVVNELETALGSVLS